MEKLIYNLLDRKFKPHFCENINEAKNLILDLIGEGQTITFGGSMTIVDAGIHTMLADKGRVAYHYELYPREEQSKFPSVTDWFLTSTNAITEAGELVNIDGRCNRIAGILGKTQNVCVICGVNKIVKNLDEAITRIKKVACPPNARRLGRELPCAYDKCPGECNCDDKMCAATLINHNPPKGKNFHIIIVNESMGY